MSSALDVNFLDASRIFVGGADTGEYRERADFAIVCCGLPSDQLNFGFLCAPYRNAAASADAVRSYFSDRKLSFQLTVRAGDGDRSIRELEEQGWSRRADPTPGMTLAMPDAPGAVPSGLAIHEVRTHEQLVGFREAAFRGFGFPTAAARIFLGDRLLALPHVRLYAGTEGGAVVATSMLVVTGAVAGIYWVATLEEQRGRGFGEALSRAAVDGGRAFGCALASLQASKLGRPVYERMGFAHALDYAHLLPPPA
jgi:GNAT superfamily N-acetyltransferase